MHFLNIVLCTSNSVIINSIFIVLDIEVLQFPDNLLIYTYIFLAYQNMGEKLHCPSEFRENQIQNGHERAILSPKVAQFQWNVNFYPQGVGIPTF